MNRDQFFFHDLSHFPIVTAKHGSAPAGYSASWIREMEMLVDNPQTFVMVVPVSYTHLDVYKRQVGRFLNLPSTFQPKT